MIEKQVLVTWYTPEEKLPPEGYMVLVTVSGTGRNVAYDHSFALAEYFDDGLGWTLETDLLDDFTVHAWADIEPYGGGE